jgi:3-hydroxybutyryl-CoA dehydratase
VEVMDKDESINRVWLRTYCTNQNGQLVVDGEAVMMPRIDAAEKTA